MPLTEEEVERAYFRAKGLLPGPVGGSDPIPVRDLIRAVAQKYGIPADRCWEMPVADLWLMVREPEETKTTVTNQAEWALVLRLGDERRALLKKLTLAERVELEELKAQLT